MVERFNRTCLMMLSMFVNDRRDNWHELLPFVMHAYRTSVHESTGYSPYRLMMGEECSLPQDVNTEELRSSRENEMAPHPFAAWVRDASGLRTPIISIFGVVRSPLATCGSVQSWTKKIIWRESIVSERDRGAHSMSASGVTLRHCAGPSIRTGAP